MEYGFSGRSMSLIEPRPRPRSPGFRSEKPEFSWTAVSISFSFCSPFHVITKFKRVYQTEIKNLLYLINSLKNTWLIIKAVLGSFFLMCIVLWMYNFEFRENKDKVWTVALPAFGVIFLLIAVSVYFSTRPKSVIEGWRKAIFMEYGFSGRGMSLIEPRPRSPGFRSEKPEFSWTAVSISFSFCSPFHVITKFKRVYQTEIKNLLYLIKPLK